MTEMGTSVTRYIVDGGGRYLDIELTQWSCEQSDWEYATRYIVLDAARYAVTKLLAGSQPATIREVTLILHDEVLR